MVSTFHNITIKNEELSISTTTLSDSVIEDEKGIMENMFVRILFLFAYIIVFASCLVGNCIVLTVIITNRAMQTITNFFLANLAIADLLVGIFCVCQNAAHFVIFKHGSWVFGRVLCHTYIYFLHMIPNSSAGILVLLSVERFIAVLRPMLVRHFLTRSVLIVCAILIWALSAIMNLPYLIAVQYIELQNVEDNTTYGICTRQSFLMADVNILKVVTIVNLAIWYFLPLSFLLIIYITIGWVLMRSTNEKSRNSIRSNICRNSSCNLSLDRKRRISNVSIITTKVSRETKIELIDSRRRVIRLVVVIVFAFAFLSAPRYIYLMWSVFRDSNAPRCLDCITVLIQPTTFLLMFINSGLNPILYAFLSQRFRSAIAETFNCFHSKHKENINIMMKSFPKKSQQQRENVCSTVTDATFFDETSEILLYRHPIKTSNEKAQNCVEMNEMLIREEN